MLTQLSRAKKIRTFYLRGSHAGAVGYVANQTASQGQGGGNRVSRQSGRLERWSGRHWECLQCPAWVKEEEALRDQESASKETEEPSGKKSLMETY